MIQQEISSSNDITYHSPEMRIKVLQAILPQQEKLLYVYHNSGLEESFKRTLREYTKNKRELQGYMRSNPEEFI